MIWIVFLVSSVAFFWDINSFPLRNWDEAWYAEIIKNMASGQHGLLVPFWNGQYYFDKPPLYFWLSLPFFKLFGPGEWQARIISDFAAIGVSVLVYLIGKRLFSSLVGFLSFLIFITLGQVYVRFSHGNLDALLVFLFLASFYFYLLSEAKKNFSVFAGAGLGLGFLVKGWLLGLFPLTLVFIYSLFKERKPPRNLGILLPFIFLSSAWWYFLGYREFGKPFLDWYLFTPAEGGFSRPFSSFSVGYFKYLVRDSGIWVIPVLISLLLVGKIRFFDWRKIFPLIFLPLLFIFIISFLSQKPDWHILPAYPFVAIIAGYFVGKMLEKYSLKILLVIVPLIIIQLFIIYKIENTYPDRSLVGARLGMYACNVLGGQDVVILDDRDFTAFLYYSNQQTVYAVRDEGPTDKRDWWILKYEDILNFVKTKGRVIIISRNIKKLPINLSKDEILGSWDGYQFMKIFKN